MSKIESVRRAQRRGWHVVTIPQSAKWLDIVEWCDSRSNGYYVFSYSLGKIAFEQAKDANWFTLRWS
jgi:hypothetical protein